MTVKTLMIVGGGWEQVSLIKAASARGLRIVLTDSSPTCPGREWADCFYSVEPRNLPELLTIAEKEHLDGITADECDYSHYAAAFIAEQLHLPGDGLTPSQYTSNKKWMRERVRDAEVMQPRFFACATLDNARSAADLIGWPIIVKPLDNRGAFGVNVVREERELERAFLDALMNAHSREVIVEAFVEGIHITVDGCVDQVGVHHNLALASKKIIPGDKPIITEVLYPADITETQAQQVLQTNIRVIEALCIKSGLTHSEYIIDDRGRCFLVETANRGGGVLTSALIVPRLSGVDINGLLLANALGESFAVEPVDSGSCCVLTFFVFKPGRMREVLGIDKVQLLPGVLHFRLLVEPGDELISPRSGAGRHGFAILEAQDKVALKHLYEKIENSIEVIYD